MVTSASRIKFSGTDYGLLMRLEWDTPLPQLLVELEEHLQQSRTFFNGAQVFLEVGQRPILQQDMEQLAVILERYDVSLQGVISPSNGQSRRPTTTPRTAAASTSRSKLDVARGTSHGSLRGKDRGRGTCHRRRRRQPRS